MIKNLLNADEEPPPGTKVIIEDSVVNPTVETPDAEIQSAQETPETFEIPAEAKFFTKPSETPIVAAPVDDDSESVAALAAEIENLAPEDLERLERELEAAQAEEIASPATESERVSPENLKTAETPVNALLDAEKAPEKTIDNPAETIFQSDYAPPSTGETIRQSGLAYSAAIVLFGSVIFMMILGWFADLLLGSKPWGIVGGIILGGIIGFIQLFRITSQIFKK